MNQIMKKGLSVLLVLFVLISLLPNVTITSSAASWVKNWGQREEVCDELSDRAVAWYDKYDVTYDELAALSGNAAIVSTPGSALYGELKDLMKGAHSTITSYGDTKSMYQYTDCQNGGGKISSFYSGAAIGPAWGEGGSWNREHTWPNSKGLGGSDENDIMMLRPTATSENSSRGNTAYGKSSGYFNPNSASGGNYDLRGDVARICLYVYVRWGNTGKMWGTAGVIESKAVLLEWMEADPVDTWEMGRNDSVESITGTRNVFVDYPELAFELFEEDVPDMPTPSGIASETKFNISAQSSNTAHGTVSVDDKVITATPAYGYEVTGYELISGTATVSRNGNTFTVDASSDCTVKIHFAEKAKVTVTYTENGVTVSEKTVYTGDTVTLPQHSDTIDDGVSFVGWVSESISETTTRPMGILRANTGYVVTSDITLQALYSHSEGDGDSEYTLVKSADQLQAGNKVIIASATGSVAMSNQQNTGNRSSAAITKSGNVISFTDSVAQLQLGAGSANGTYSFYCSENSGYLACVNGTLATQTSLDAGASFAITVNADGTCNLVSQATDAATTHLKYRPSFGKVFVCTSSGWLEAVSLYVSSPTGTSYYYTQIDSGELTISQQPESITTGVGKTALFQVTARGTDVCYQWQYRISATGAWKNATATGNKTATLSVPATTGRNGYQYRCKITDSLSQTVYSDVVTLKVITLSLTAQPESVYMPIGTTAKLSVAAAGSEISYQWQYRASASGVWKNATASGNKTATLKVPVAAFRDGYQYRCKVTDTYGNQVFSKVAVLNTITLEVITQPVNRYLPTGKTANFTVAVSGSDLSYQWQYRTSSTGKWASSPATGNKTATLKIPVTTGRNGYQYRCKITDGYGNVIYSDAATLKTVTLKITAQPVSKTLAIGKTATFTVAADGTGLKYQWQYRTSAAGKWLNSPASGNKTATVKIPVTAGRDGYQYRCKVTDTYGNVIYCATVTLDVL